MTTSNETFIKSSMKTLGFCAVSLRDVRTPTDFMRVLSLSHTRKNVILFCFAPYPEIVRKTLLKDANGINLFFSRAMFFKEKVSLTTVNPDSEQRIKNQIRLVFENHVKECPVCMVEIQSEQRKVCETCANALCEQCWKKVDSCPFCRETLNLFKV